LQWVHTSVAGYLVGSFTGISDSDISDYSSNELDIQSASRPQIQYLQFPNRFIKIQYFEPTMKNKDDDDYLPVNARQVGGGREQKED
jgi:hypothetical protein